MRQIDETQALKHVCQRLAEHFPEVDLVTVRLAVDQAHDRLDGPVRQYIPILVERAAREVLVTVPGSSAAKTTQVKSRDPN